MPEYIERKIATNVIGNIDTSHPYDDKDDIIEQAIGLIDHIPSADVAPVRHGRWVHKILLGEQAWFCSECKTIGSPQWKRCPVCEAKMD